MTRIKWHEEEQKLTQGGIDRGVLYPQNKPAVPWNGLISVTESGAQDTSTYYVDGHKFLTTVTPREYNGTLEAYTFPDEFAEICGIVEAADGLFLDSQVPDQFGLSYRTLYNDGKSYKLHLLYGVTAAMSDTTYQTLGDSSDPTTFSFDISATPQRIDGFRPTAHVIIDSRNLSHDILTTIENMIYGSYNNEAYLPTIKSLFDMMNYGDIVVIRDNADGTWEAEGSHKYIDVDPNTGRFTIRNVEAHDHGDGTYHVASTGETIPPHV
jgi:hypothetical protein